MQTRLGSPLERDRRKPRAATSRVRATLNHFDPDRIRRLVRERHGPVKATASEKARVDIAKEVRDGRRRARTVECHADVASLGLYDEPDRVWRRSTRPSRLPRDCRRAKDERK